MTQVQPEECLRRWRHANVAVYWGKQVLCDQCQRKTRWESSYRENVICMECGMEIAQHVPYLEQPLET